MFNRNNIKKDGMEFLIYHHEELERRGVLYTFMDIVGADKVTINGSKYFCKLNLGIMDKASKRYGSNIMVAMGDVENANVIEVIAIFVSELILDNYGVDMFDAIMEMGFKEYEALLKDLEKIMERGKI